jgi:alanine racemase
LKPPELILDLDAVRHNVRAWLGWLAGRELWPVVKSDAYGLGLTRVADACIEAGAQRLCVVDISEARRLREHGVQAPIVHVWATPPEEFEEAIKLRTIVTIEDEHGASELSRVATSKGSIAVAHVAIETGTGWSGIPAQRATAFANAVRSLPAVRWEGAWTHIAGREQMPSQVDQFNTALEQMRNLGLPLPMDHVAATAPALWGAGGSAARIGIGLYGASGGTVRNLPLRTAVTLRASILSVKKFDRPTALGYGGLNLAKPGESIATLRLGYADGLPRAVAGGGVVLINGDRCPIVGAIGMNFSMVKLPYGSSIHPGDIASVVGDEDGIRLDQVAQRAGTIPHQLVTSLAALSARPSV